MPKRDKPAWDGCPIRYASGLFGDKWSLLILRDLMFKGRRYFGEFQEAGEGISTNTLTDRLNRLQAGGLIVKQPDPAKASRVIYTLTEKGLSLMPVMLAMINWSAVHDPETEVPADFARALTEDPEALQQDLEEAVRRKDADLLS